MLIIIYIIYFEGLIAKVELEADKYESEEAHKIDKSSMFQALKVDENSKYISFQYFIYYV